MRMRSVALNAIVGAHLVGPNLGSVALHWLHLTREAPTLSSASMSLSPVRRKTQMVHTSGEKDKNKRHEIVRKQGWSIRDAGDREIAQFTKLCLVHFQEFIKYLYTQQKLFGAHQVTNLEASLILLN